MEGQIGDVRGVSIAGYGHNLVAGSQPFEPGAAFSFQLVCQVAIPDVLANNTHSLGLSYFWLVYSPSMPLVM